MSEQQRMDRLGVSKAEYFFASHGWLFREQYLHDYGIDAQVEIVKEGKPTGELIAMQIKSGASYFSEQTDTHIVFRTDDSHIQYWSRHSLPVILILYDQGTDTMYWENVTSETIIDTGKGWKLYVPLNKKLTSESLDYLCGLTQPPPYIRRLNKLRLDKKWIQLLANGENVYIEYEDWVNKSLPRFGIRIGCNSRKDVESEEWPTIYGVGLSMEEAITHVLPWADYKMDYDALEEYMESVWAAECYMGYDREDDTTYYSMPFCEWYKNNRPEGISPVSANGETEGYRLILSLNELGRAFLVIDEYLSEGDELERRVFSLD